MKILSLDTGGLVSPDAATIVALDWDEGEDVSIVALESLEEPRKMGATLAESIQRVLETAFWAVEELDGLVVGLGPGSWTSLRVGVATMKTLSQTLEIPLVGVASFDALASAAHRALFEHQMETQKGKPKKKRASEQDSSQILLTLSQCRPGLLYGKIFHRSNEFLAPAQSEWIADIKTHTDAAYSQALSENIEAPLVLCGAGAIEAAEFLQDREESCVVVEIEAAQVAIEMAISGAFKLASGEVTPLDDIAPLYLAPSNAERVREEALAAR